QHRTALAAGAEGVQGADDREGVLPFAGAQVVLGDAEELRGVRPLLLGLTRRRGALGPAVGGGGEAAQHRVGGRVGGAVGEEFGERVAGGVLGGPGADELHQLHGQRPDDGDLDVVEGDGRAAAGERFEVSGHGGDRYFRSCAGGGWGPEGHFRSCWRV